ncbi:DUF6602 domain-containing protein [Oceanospirillum sediminis]|uniref:DUF6602 domain-containing protein n=1 Tax=Oceanospirillum sediminis TaxID=2760088 RepID=A0A839IQ12_9GAMM|nr:DUF6602 domain-containing protein [Oceanospirillum sediminis]MBB1486790.1 hypothetical protein [Oceanospirillum sediminis]
MNPVKHTIQSRINSLKEISKGFDAINHSATKGTLRENGLIEFFKEVIPSKLSISSGIICDASGGVSNQTDFIVYDRGVLPPLFLSSEISLIPVDSVYLTAEIKSNLRKKDLDQISDARKNFTKLKLSSFSDESENKSDVKIPTVVLAYATDIAENTLVKWMEKEEGVVSICVIDRFTLSKERDSIKKHEYSSENKLNNETLIFISQLFNHLNIEITKTRPKSNWEAYILGAKEFAKKHGITMK